MKRDETRQIVCLSGGKDSTALAISLRDRVPDLEYVFMDTDMELAETYEHLSRLEAYLGAPIVRLNAERGFDHWLEVQGAASSPPRRTAGAPASSRSGPSSGTSAATGW